MHFICVYQGIGESNIREACKFFVPLLMMNTNFRGIIVEWCKKIGLYKLNCHIQVERYLEKTKRMKSQDMFPSWQKEWLKNQSYKKQHKIKNYFIVRPCNVYGPGDNFDPKNAMVIPLLKEWQQRRQ